MEDYKVEHWTYSTDGYVGILTDENTGKNIEIPVKVLRNLVYNINNQFTVQKFDEMIEFLKEAGYY